MSALALLADLTAAGITVTAQHDALAFKAPPGTMKPDRIAALREHKAALLTLLDGSTCRWCQGPLAWRSNPTPLALGDGTSVHAACRPAFENDRLMRAAERALAPHLAEDEAELMLRGEADR